jgi:hypothetical protein
VEDDDAVVRGLLEGAGLSPPEDQLALLVASYPRTRALVGALYAIPEARYEEPATVYTPLPDEGEEAGG